MIETAGQEWNDSLSEAIRTNIHAKTIGQLGTILSMLIAVELALMPLEPYTMY